MARRKKDKRGSDRIYDNTLALDVDGQPLFRCAARKALYYLESGLAVRVGAGEPLVIRLLFRPAGPGRRGDDYLLQALENRCVVCGATEELSRHHVVPACYRRWFPDEVGYLTHYDIVALCLTCHEAYEKHARQFKRQLEDEFNVPAECRRRAVDHRLSAVRGRAGALLKYLGQMPAARIAEYLKTVQEYYGRERITRDDLVEAAIIEVHADGGDFITAGEYIVRQMKTPEEIDRFAVRWRAHFKVQMQPRFLAPSWEVGRNANGSLQPEDRGKARKNRPRATADKARDRAARRQRSMRRRLTRVDGSSSTHKTVRV